MSNLPKAAIVSSFSSRTRSFFRRWGGTIAKTCAFIYRRRGAVLLILAATAVSTSGLWCALQIDACIDRGKAECKAIGGKRIEIVRFQNNNNHYYTLNAAKEFNEYGLAKAKILIDVPRTEKLYVVLSTKYELGDCIISGEVHLRSPGDVE